MQTCIRFKNVIKSRKHNQMKKIFFVSLTIILFSCSDKKSNYPWSDLTFNEVLNLKTDKIIFLDFKEVHYSS